MSAALEELKTERSDRHPVRRGVRECLRLPDRHIESAPPFAVHGLFVVGATELFATSAVDGITLASTVPAFRVPQDGGAAPDRARCQRGCQGRMP
ncbi:MAG TPA: hypothetical protein VKI44_43615 [Acetobacteraceae bacterium]|nr:hypothetical protein [Acetobacteraceae bacterium]